MNLQCPPELLAAFMEINKNDLIFVLKHTRSLHGFLFQPDSKLLAPSQLYKYFCDTYPEENKTSFPLIKPL